MRIGINTLFLVPGDVGGTEIYLRENLKEMVSGEPGTEFVLFTTRDNEAVWRSDLQPFAHVDYVQLAIRAANRPLRIVSEQFLLPRYIRKNKVDVLWSPGYTAPIQCSCPQAVTIHDLQYKSHPDDLSRLERATLDFLVRSACRVCDAVIAVSEFSRQEILKYGFASPEKVFTVVEGVDPAFSSHLPAADTVNPAAALTAAPYILCVAHTYPHKKVHVLINAFARISDKIPHHLVLVGKPRRGEEQVRKSLAALSCPDRVHRLSDLEYAELAVVYQEADIFVLPSEYEGFGLPVLEALQAGVPVITTDKASLPEVGGLDTVYVQDSRPEEFAQAILDVISWDSERRKRKVMAGQAWASSFTWQRSAAQTLQVLRSLVMKK
jgi:glycosyltransferase involved in cell wall biosynthesis